jgi:hypothetical protein
MLRFAQCRFFSPFPFTFYSEPMPLVRFTFLFPPSALACKVNFLLFIYLSLNCIRCCFVFLHPPPGLFNFLAFCCCFHVLFCFCCCFSWSDITLGLCVSEDSSAAAVQRWVDHVASALPESTPQMQILIQPMERRGVGADDGSRGNEAAS